MNGVGLTPCEHYLSECMKAYNGGGLFPERCPACNTRWYHYNKAYKRRQKEIVSFARMKTRQACKMLGEIMGKEKAHE